MPKWEASKKRTNVHPIHFILIILNSMFLYWTIGTFFANQIFRTTFLLMVSLSYTLFYLGRLYGELNSHKDFIDVNTESIQYRNTPAFGEGWLPQSGLLDFKEVVSADIVLTHPFYNPDLQRMAILLIINHARNKSRVLLIGNNLDEENIIRVGLALQGRVTLSRALKKLLGTSENDDPLKDIIDIGKSIWKNIQNRRG